MGGGTITMMMAVTKTMVDWLRKVMVGVDTVRAAVEEIVLMRMVTN